MFVLFLIGEGDPALPWPVSEGHPKREGASCRRRFG